MVRVTFLPKASILGHKGSQVTVDSTARDNSFPVLY